MTSRFAFHGYLLRLVVEMTILFVFVLLADVFIIFVLVRSCLPFSKSTAYFSALSQRRQLLVKCFMLALECKIPFKSRSAEKYLYL